MSSKCFQACEATLKIAREVVIGSAFSSLRSSRILLMFLAEAAWRALITKYKVDQNSYVMYNVKLRCTNCKTWHV